jgi:hypothetical protein
MIRENIQVTIRLLFADMPAAGKILEIINACPRLYESVLAVADRQDEDEEQSTLAVESDHLHWHALTARTVTRSHGRNVLRLPSTCHDIPKQHAFNLELRRAHEVDYNMSHIYDLEGKPVQWVQRFSFTDKYAIALYSYMLTHTC